MLNIDFCYCLFFVRHEQPLCTFSIPWGGCHATLYSVTWSTAAACWHFPPQAAAGNATATSVPELPAPVTSTSTTTATWITGMDNKDSICFPHTMLQDSMKANGFVICWPWATFSVIIPSFCWSMALFRTSFVTVMVDRQQAVRMARRIPLLKSELLIKKQHLTLCDFQTGIQICQVFSLSGFVQVMENLESHGI